MKEERRLGMNEDERSSSGLTDMEMKSGGDRDINFSLTSSLYLPFKKKIES